MILDKPLFISLFFHFMHYVRLVLARLRDI